MKREEAIEELSLALLYLTRFNDNESPDRSMEMSWKGYDFEALATLEKKGLIFEPSRSRGRSRYVYLTEEGRKAAKVILEKYDLPDKELFQKFVFRCIRLEEAEEASDIEQICFPQNEACSPEDMRSRIQDASDFFLVAADRETGKIAGFLNGIATNEECFRDAFFTDASLHEPNGKNVMLCGLDVRPEYREIGLAKELVYRYAQIEKARGRHALILTCLAEKVKMYSRMGFTDRGLSGSRWGGEAWHEMDMILNISYV